jgi:hypothetical protein
MHAGVDSEPADNILATVVALDSPALRAGKDHLCSQAVNFTVETEVEGKPLSQAVGVVVGDETNDYVRNNITPFPRLAGGKAFEKLDLGVVEQLRLEGLRNSR